MPEVKEFNAGSFAHSNMVNRNRLKLLTYSVNILKTDWQTFKMAEIECKLNGSLF